MPCGAIKFGGRVAHITFGGDFKPGDPAPTGYLDWQEWAAIQHKAGLRQQQCGSCGLWRFPQEMTEKRREWTAHTSKGQPIKVLAPICAQCGDNCS